MRVVSGRPLVALGLLALGLLTRWPLRGTILEEYDSANYALAALELDLFREQPHPPGYIFYVAATRAAVAMTGDPIAALTAVSVLSGAVAAVLLFELLLGWLGTGRAAFASVAVLASGPVWMQHVRPMQDAFAFASMLAAALIVVRATARGSRSAWMMAMAVVGVSAGAKQVLPLFMAGLLLWAAHGAWIRGGARWLVLGAAALLAGSLLWLVPLSIVCGSPLTYLEWALGQVAWQRENDAALFALDGARLARQLQATFVAAAGPPAMAWPLWGLAAVGAFLAARRPEARWLLWLLLPLVAMRLLLLGPWPRFSLYYIPFVIALAVAGLGELLLRMSASRMLRAAAAIGSLALWCALQAAHVLPTLRAVHRGPSPAGQAIDAVAARFPAAATLLLTERGTLGRHAAYYARRRGIAHAIEEDLAPGRLREVRHVVKLHGVRPATAAAAWTGEGERIGTWHLAVPRAAELTPSPEIWQVSAFELRGAYVRLRRFHVDDAGRTYATPESAVVVFHAPTGGFSIRFHFAAAGAMRFVVGDGRTVAWAGGGPSYVLAISAAEAADGRVRIDVVPECGDASCVELTRVEVVAR